jgi:SAM-dependent methyltransferase
MDRKETRDGKLTGGRLEDQFNLLTTYDTPSPLLFFCLFSPEFHLTSKSRNIGYHIHPSIAKRLPPNARIADVATGTGVYLQQLAESYPDATLDGYDNSPLQFPDEASLAQNVKLNLLDVKKPIPRELQGTYDFVHVRLLSAAMLATDWKPVVCNLVQLLKPGGALQWEECNFLAAEQLRGFVESTVSAVQRIERLLLEAFREHFQTGWNTLDSDMINAGLVEVQRDVVSSDRVPETRAATTKNSMVACFSWARSDKDHVPLDTVELLELERQAYRDIESGGYVRFDIHSVFGFKPELAVSKD